MKRHLSLLICLLGIAGQAQTLDYMNLTTARDTLDISLRKISYRLSMAPVIVTNLLTRPANFTTAYTNGNAVCMSASATNLPIELVNALPVGSGQIVKLRVIADSTNAVGTLRYWFYTGTNVTAQADNTVYQIRWTNAPTQLGFIDVTLTNGTDCSYGLNYINHMDVWAPSGSSSLFFAVQTLTSFTPTAFTNIFTEVTIYPNK